MEHSVYTKALRVAFGIATICLLPASVEVEGKLQAEAVTSLQSQCMQELSSASMSDILEQEPSPSKYGFHILSGNIKRSNSPKTITWDKTTSVRLEGFTRGNGPMGPFRSFTGKGYELKRSEQIAFLKALQSKFAKTIAANGGRVVGPSLAKHEGFADGEGFALNYSQDASKGRITVRTYFGMSRMEISCHEDTPLR